MTTINMSGPSSAICIGIVGAGKITLDQHLPAIRANAQFELGGYTSTGPPLSGVHAFPNLAAMVADPEINAVAVNTPPLVRFGIAREAILAGKHVMLEKPPAGTVAELHELTRLADRMGTTLFAAWHSQHAAGVSPARKWLADRTVKRIDVQWCENVRQWHPGQSWIWQAGGFGVFDPGINMLSILSAILPQPARIESAVLEFPENCHAPIAADLVGGVGDDGTLSIRLDFLQAGSQTWTIEIETDGKTLTLEEGGATLSIDGKAQKLGPSREYPSLYQRFADLITSGESEVDTTPLALAADAFLVGERRIVDAFVE